MAVEVDGSLEPVGFDNQQVARQMFQRALGCCTDKQPFPTVARNGTHDHNISFELFRDQRQFFMSQPRNKVGFVCS